MPSIATIVWRGQIRKYFVDAIGRQIRSLRALQKVHSIARARGDIIGAADNPQRNVRDIIIRAPAIGPAGFVHAQCRAKPVLILGLCRRNFQIETKELRAWIAAIRSRQRLAGILQ